jgi:hypothetical protein
MNFSAQGYAALAARLQAHIAVLEGGYAIEGALPYVNAGIILAMAGMDFSRVREPDYDPRKIRQRSEVTAMIERVCDVVLSFWEQRQVKREKILNEKDYEERSRQIFYDTDMIHESQRERIRVCPDCAGALRIDSSSSKSHRILAVHVPRKACAVCRQTGQDWYDSADWGDYDFIFLQDRPKDTFLERK